MKIKKYISGLKIIAYIPLVFMLLGVLFNACDEIDEPYVEEDAIVWHGRKILIMEFTAHRCPNCPEGHEEIENLQSAFPEAIVTVAVHCGLDAMPVTSDTTEPYHYDFTSDISIELGGDGGITSDGYFNISGKPTATINEFAPGNLFNVQAWRSEVAKYIQTYPEYSIDIDADYSEHDSLMSADVSVEAVLDSKRNLHLCVYVVESNIIEWQKTLEDPDGVEDYQHNHVLRASMNGVYGENINSGNANITVGYEFTRTYGMAVDDEWDPQHLHVVAFVYDSDSYEVLQSEEIPLFDQ
ncbi:MAG: Omp28-related outer membrane protein [Bacteroidales bacterium]